MAVPGKKVIAKVVRDLKTYQKDIAFKRDQLSELKDTVEELISDCNDADGDIQAAIDKLSRLQ